MKLTLKTLTAATLICIGAYSAMLLMMMAINKVIEIVEPLTR